MKKQCANCYWSLLSDGDFKGQNLECSKELPFWADEVKTAVRVKPTDGANCPCWEKIP